MKTARFFRTHNCTSGKQGERGVTLVMVAVAILALMGMAALAVDLGVLYTARTSAQHAADAAALAGAYTFVAPTEAQPTAAQNAAIAMAAKNYVMGQQVVLTAANVVVDQPNQRVTVTVNRNAGNSNPIQTFFASALGFTSMGTGATATAEAGKAGTASNCLKPIFLPNSIMGGGDPTADCNAGKYIFNQNGTVSAWAAPKFAAATRSPTLIRPADPSKALGPSQFYSLDFGNAVVGHGATVYQCTLGQCLNECGVTPTIACGNSALLDAKTGNMVGPTTAGINNLIGNPPADTWDGVDKYFNKAAGLDFDTSRALAVAPVWNDCTNIGGTKVGPGTQQSIPILGFVEVFIDSVVESGKSRGDTTAHIVRPLTCAANGGGGGGTNTGPLAIPVRLVQVPTAP